MQYIWLRYQNISSERPSTSSSFLTPARWDDSGEGLLRRAGRVGMAKVKRRSLRHQCTERATYPLAGPQGGTQGSRRPQMSPKLLMQPPLQPGWKVMMLSFSGPYLGKVSHSLGKLVPTLLGCGIDGGSLASCSSLARCTDLNQRSRPWGHSKRRHMPGRPRTSAQRVACRQLHDCTWGGAKGLQRN